MSGKAGENQIREVSHRVSDFRAMLEGKEPDVEVGDHCHTPHDCPFIQHCWPPEPEYPVTLLPREKGEASTLQEEGHTDLREVPEGRLTRPEHERIWRVTRNGKAELLPGAGEILRRLPYPRYYLDFETTAFAAIPIWKGTHPYEAHLPFQWSCHIERDDGSMDHAEFLDTSGEPPMRALAEKLITTLGNEGSVFMYSSFERGVISKLTEMFPDLSEALERIAERLFDLLPLVRKHYYHPDMKGSWSIKAVLPTIAPDLRYEDLGNIQDGMAASSAFMKIISGTMGDEDKQETRDKRIRSSFIALQTTYDPVISILFLPCFLLFSRLELTSF
ncbi:hypothetical protein BMS3Bbin04_00293 [bacterium BMS3Bbin04]|nr:hypothetical protein BMS3Bbin04_00293 [bacterium BMS3Bbin04]